MQIIIQDFDEDVSLNAAKAAIDYLIQNREAPSGLTVQEAPSQDLAPETGVVPPAPDIAPPTVPEVPFEAPTGQVPPPPAEPLGDTPIADATSSQTHNEEQGPTGEVDNDGVPWDERIHSSAKTQTAKGVWKKKRNLPAGLYEQVMAELKGQSPTVAVDPAAGSDQTVTATVPPAPNEAPPPEAPAATGGQMGWTDVLQKVMDAKISGALSQEQVDRQCTEMGLAGFNDLMAYPERYEEFTMSLML